MDSYVLFTLFYILFTSCFLFPPQEFVSVGLTVESIFSRWLRNEEDSFIHYHMKRILATLMIHSLMPLGYLFGLKNLLPNSSIWDGNLIWKLYIVSAITLPFLVAIVISDWQRGEWRKHPVGRALMYFTTSDTSLNHIARDINNEYRRVDKIIIKCNSITRVIATDNWIIKVSPYMLNVAHQSDMTLEVSSSDTHQFVPDRPGSVQYLTIDVKSSRPQVKPFQIRINSADFKDLQDKVIRPIRILDNVVVHKTLTDRFLDTFKEQVLQNPSIEEPENLDVCIGCMQAKPNIKLYTSCGDDSAEIGCTMCYCRPMWCIDCMGKWFASRQDQERPDTWLSSKCTCPMCRSRFCILDICPLVSITEPENIS